MRLITFLLIAGVTIFAKLIKVQMFIRHGDRTPVFHLDSYQQKWNCSAVDCSGQLTDIGRRAQFLLGHETRRLYINTFDFIHNSQDVKIISTNFTRTIESAQLFYSALFPLNTTTVIPEICDYMYLQHANLSEIKQEIYKQENWTTFVSSNQRFQDELYKKFNVTDFPWVGFYDVFHTHSAHGYPLPVDANIVQRVTYLAEYEWMLMISNPTYLKLGISQMLNKIRLELESKEKFILFSGHDTTIAPLLQYLGLWTGEFPDYSSNIIMEIHEEENGRKYVKVLYNFRHLKQIDLNVFY
jgi:hypothetical protein